VGSDVPDTNDSLGYEPTIVHPGLQSRETAGPYRLVGLIGGGGMGVVHRAIGPDGTVCAVKTLRADLVDPKAVRRFAREASVRISHPNVLRVLDDGTDPDGTPYIVFELLEGENLERRFRAGALSPRETVDLGLQACEGLAAAHAAGIVHRDLKPANLFLCDDGTLKVLDFGIALLPSAPKVTATGMVLGTPAYLSPEQGRGTLELDPRTDVWAMGAVLYEALTGSPPFESDSFFGTVVSILTEPVPPLAAKAPDVPPSLVALVHRCLAKDRDARFADARALADALRSVDDPEAAEALMVGAPTIQLPTKSPTIPAGEERIVAVLLAEGVTDYGLVEKAIRDRGGEPLSRFRGSVLGLFGATHWAGDEASRAVDAALEVRPHVDRVAVASGRAASSAGGIAGAAVNAAERGCRSDLDGVALDPPTARTVETRFTVQQIADGLFEVLGQRPPSWLSPRPIEADALLGREAQVGQIRFALETVLSEGRAMTVLVTGPAGIGKTALRQELEHLIAETEEPIRVFVARAEPIHQQTAWSFVASLIRRRTVARSADAGWPSIDHGAPLDQRREAVARLAAEAIADPGQARRCADFLGEIVGVPMPDNVRLQAARADPRLMADQIRLAVQDWLGGHAAHGCMALLLEDVDWADAASLDLLEQVVDGLEENPLLVFATARKVPDRHDRRLLSSHDTVAIRLKGLPRAVIGRLASTVIGRPLPERVTDLLAERTEGNPLFVRELVLALAEQNKLEAADLSEQPLPLSVEAAVQSRLDLLTPEERELCKRASVFGRPFSAEELEALDVSGADALLTALRRRDVVTRHAAGVGRRVYTFRSSLVRDVAFNTIAPEARAALRRAIATHLEGAEGADLEEIARHHDLGGSGERAAEFWARAALAAAERGDSPSVTRCSDRAIELGAPESERWALHMARAEAHRFLLQRDEQNDELQAALACAADDVQRAAARRQIAFWLSRAGRVEDAIEVGSRAVADADASADSTSRALARCTLAQAQIVLGRMEEADALLQTADELSLRAGPVVRAQVAEGRAFSASAQGDVGRMREAWAATVELYREAGHIREAASNEQNLADAYNRVGAFAEAEEALREALEGCRRVGNRVGEAYALANLGYARTMSGRVGEALESLAQAERLATEMEDARLGVAVRIYRARALLRSGSHESAASEAASAAEDAEKLGLSSLAVSGHALAAQAFLECDRIEEALARSAEALAMRDALGGIEEDEAEVFVTRANALESAGRTDEARGVRRGGVERLLAVAARIEDATARERFLHDVPAHRALLERDR